MVLLKGMRLSNNRRDFFVYKIKSQREDLGAAEEGASSPFACPRIKAYETFRLSPRWIEPSGTEVPEKITESEADRVFTH